MINTSLLPESRPFVESHYFLDIGLELFDSEFVVEIHDDQHKGDHYKEDLEEGHGVGLEPVRPRMWHVRTP